jgi:hypothetical protein
MSRNADVIAISAVFLSLLLLVWSGCTSIVNSKVVDIEGDEYVVTDIKTYGNVSGVWFEKPDRSIDEIYYSVKIGPETIQKKILLSDIKEISFEHDDSDNVVRMQVIKRNGDVIEVDYAQHKVTEKVKDGEIRQYETTEDKNSPGLIGDIKIEGKQLMWLGFMGKEIIPEGKGDFFVDYSFVKKIIFGTPQIKNIQ